MKEVNVTITQTLSKTFKIYTDNTESIREAFVEQHWDIPNLLNILESYLMNELQNQEGRMHRIPKLLEILDSCRNWKVDDTTITVQSNDENKTDNKNRKPANESEF